MLKVRWGVLSTAGIAQKALLPAFARAENAEVVAIATNSDVEKAEAIAEKFQIKNVFDSYNQLLEDSSIDAVYIPLPNHLHKPWVIKAAEHGKHILCEKPAGLNVAEVEEMEAACKKNKVLLMEAFMYHFHPQHERVRDIIASGEIGEVRYMRAGFTFYLDKHANNIRLSAEKGGGSLYDVGCYAIHSIRNILGKEPISVQAFPNIDSDTGVDLDVQGYLDFGDGVRASFDASFQLADRNEYEVFGTKGKIVVPRAYRPDKNGGEGLVIVEKKDERREEIVQGDQYKRQVEHMSDAIQTNQTQLYHDLENTKNNMKVIEACL